MILAPAMSQSRHSIVRRVQHVMFCAFCGLLFSVLAACSVVVIPKDEPNEQPAPLRLNVRAIVVEKTSSDEETNPSEDPRQSRALRQALDVWSRTQLQTVGGDDTLYLVVRRARILDVVLPKPKDAGPWDDYTSDRLEGELDIRLETRDARGFVLRSASAHVAKTRYASSSMTVSDRDERHALLIRSLIGAVDQEIRRPLMNHLGDLIAP